MSNVIKEVVASHISSRQQQDRNKIIAYTALEYLQADLQRQLEPLKALCDFSIGINFLNSRGYVRFEGVKHEVYFHVEFFAYGRAKLTMGVTGLDTAFVKTTASDMFNGLDGIEDATARCLNDLRGAFIELVKVLSK